MSNLYAIKVENDLVYIRVNKNEAVCDIQPRVGDLLNIYQGRPFDLCARELSDAIKENYEK